MSREAKPSTATRRMPVVLQPWEGRAYQMPAMRAVFKADGDETDSRYSVSEWWLEPGCEGPGKHAHPANDEIFYAIEGTPSVLVGKHWIDAPAGSCIVIPAGVTHDFANRTETRAGLFNVFLPGGFEQNMPSIVQSYEENG